MRAMDGNVMAGLRAYASKLVAMVRNNRVAGFCDGVDDGSLTGWAWLPNAPDAHVEVEQWVDGELRAKTVANLPRQDLEDVVTGAHAWRMPLWLDRDKPGVQRVEVRVSGGEILPPGIFHFVRPDALTPKQPADSAPQEPASAVVGYCDGVDGRYAQGWAWCPSVPEEHVEIEQWVDGSLVEQTVANLSRSDLSAAKVGTGRYGWRMPLALNAAKTGPQQIEFRIKGGPAVTGGQFTLAYADIVPDGAESSSAAEGEERIVAYCDGLKGSTLHGWARNLLKPDEPVEIELWVDGALVCDTVADEFRPDLRAQGEGHGRYAWRLPLQLDPERETPMQVEVRIKGGKPVNDGVFELKYDLSLDDPANAAFAPFVASVLKPRENPLTSAAVSSARPAAFVIYCPEQRSGGAYWAPEYDDYAGAAAAFASVLRGLGSVVEVGSLEEAEETCATLKAQSENCILLSFAPPRLAPLEASCPVVPVFAWSFPTLPTGRWDRDPRSDWRYVLRQTGRAIVFSSFAAEAVRAEMGADYPVAVIPVPAPHGSDGKRARARRITFDGAIFDSRAFTFDASMTEFPPPLWSGDEAGKRGLDLEGVVFTAELDLFDGRSNWRDLVSAFVFANLRRPDAVLLLKLNEAASDWWSQLFKWLCRLPKFDCRVIAVRASLDDGDWSALIAASDWSASAVKAEGFCLMRQILMRAGRPAVTPLHTAALDYVSETDALVVASEEEAWTWPDDKEKEGFSWTQHPDDVGPTTRNRVSWTSLRDQLSAAYDISKTDAARYQALSAAASVALRDWSDEAVVSARLDAFLGLNQHKSGQVAAPSRLLAETSPL